MWHWGRKYGGRQKMKDNIGKYILKNWEMIEIIINEKSLENVNQAN